MENSLCGKMKKQLKLNTKPKPRSHALIYTRYVNYTYMYNLHPGVKIYLLRVHMFLNLLDQTVHKSFNLRRRLIFVWNRSMNARFSCFLDKRDTF